MNRYINVPSYDTPWKLRENDLATIKFRNPDVDPGSIIFEWKEDRPARENER